MALYVHPENQELLWNIMNQTPYLKTMLSYQTIEQKQEWFKSVIQLFYQQNNHRTLDKAELNQLNKDTLSYMLNYAKAAPPSNNIESSILSQRNQRTVETFQPKISTPPIVPDNRAEMFNQQFNVRQKEYETMLDRKPPTEPDFKETVSDGVISNMDELIKKHMAERDEVLKQYAPKPLIPLPENTVEPVKPKENVTLEPENPLEAKVSTLSDKITALLEQIQILQEKVDKIHIKSTVLPNVPTDSVIPTDTVVPTLQPEQER